MLKRMVYGVGCLPPLPFTEVVCRAGQSAVLLCPTVNTGFERIAFQIKVMPKLPRSLIELPDLPHYIFVIVNLLR